MAGAEPSGILVLTESPNGTSGMPSKLSNSSLVPLQTACDNCRRRKTRCDRRRPCEACQRSALSCHYLKLPKKRGPKRRKLSVSSNSESTALQLNVSDLASKSAESREANSSESPTTELCSGTVFNTDSPYSNHNVSGSTPCFSGTESSTDDLHILAQPDTLQSYIFPVDNTIVTTEQSLPAGAFDIDSILFPEGDGFAFNSEQHHSNKAMTISVFAPYLELFFKHLYPIMPIFDREADLNNPMLNTDELKILSQEEIAMYSALSALVILQLNVVIDKSGTLVPSSQEDHLRLSSNSATSSPEDMATTAYPVPAEPFVTQCLSTRQNSDFISSPTLNWIITSFFLFAYYGHLEQHRSAWYYLRESISLALELELDVEEIYETLERGESQKRRRLFWLLFVTERGYALQRRRSVILQPTIGLPLVFESQDPRLLYGFVNLVNLFKSVDQKFFGIWGEKPKYASDRPDLTDTKDLRKWLGNFQEAISRANLPLIESIETQKTDLLVTREWLHMLGWRTSVKLGLMTGKEEGKKAEFMNFEYPFTLARDLASVITSSQKPALESHGIGMEQKVSDVAICLGDVIACNSGGLDNDTIRLGQECLHVFLGLLSTFRGQRSRYVDPVLDKVRDLMTKISPQGSISNFDGIKQYTTYTKAPIGSEEEKATPPYSNFRYSKVY
ncbi:hypothetical protein TWF694_003630 [Orbilia ellipsospora]|uniref:Zn(2)-C6 fungal-type domain-containing protein n=1 Tax=Orbilia ellipsospora TaxID=2528407 RepID=A0AAV9WZZ7_9PEZI